jgi:hypothetical protein
MMNLQPITMDMMNLQPITMDMIHTEDHGNHHIQHPDMKGHVAYLKNA